MDAELTGENENSFDSLFSALDGAPTDGAPARVLGIYDDGREWWIQVARGEDDVNTIVLRLSRFARVDNMAAALTCWAASGPAPRIVPVMALV